MLHSIAVGMPSTSTVALTPTPHSSFTNTWMSSGETVNPVALKVSAALFLASSALGSSPPAAEFSHSYVKPSSPSSLATWSHTGSW